MAVKEQEHEEVTEVGVWRQFRRREAVCESKSLKSLRLPHTPRKGQGPNRALTGGEGCPIGTAFGGLPKGGALHFDGH